MREASASLASIDSAHVARMKALDAEYAAKAAPLNAQIVALEEKHRKTQIAFDSLRDQMRALVQR